MSNTPVVKGLKQVLADSYALYVKTQNYHWNVTGANFSSLHTLFEEQYTDLAAAIDEIAELIRGLGEKVPATFKVYQETSTITDGDEEASATDMIKDLVKGQETLEKVLSETLKVAEEAEDDVVADALTGRLTTHRKNKWMLNSSL